ncbi:hypothetical protein [Streptomyces sp. NPDC005573]
MPSKEDRADTVVDAAELAVETGALGWIGQSAVRLVRVALRLLD